MRRLSRYLFAFASFVGVGCSAVSERAESRPAGAPVVTGGVQEAHAATLASSTGEISKTAGGEGRGGGGGGATIRALRDSSATPVIRALYVNRFAAQSPRRMRWLVSVADSTEINGFVIDMKDEFGLNFRSDSAPFRRNEGIGHGMVHDVKALVDTLHAHKIFATARIVVFKDPVAAQLNPTWTIRRPDGEMWQDKKGTRWVDPYNRALWEYNLGVADELVRLGFDEIQFDYIRFPEPYKSLPQQVFPASNGMSKPELLATFLKTARERLNKLGVRSTADVFGFVTTVRGPLEVGQWWEKLAPVTDVLLPMTYPSHFPHGTFGIPRPNAEPYQIQKISIDAARERDQKLGITAPEHIRPWLQAFSLGKPEYGPEQLQAQKQAVYDAGYDGWVLWHPGSKYEAYVPALEKGELVSHKKNQEREPNTNGNRVTPDTEIVRKPK